MLNLFGIVIISLGKIVTEKGDEGDEGVGLGRGAGRVIVRTRDISQKDVTCVSY